MDWKLNFSKVADIKMILEGEGNESMEQKEFGLNDVVEMKKSHPCGANRWKIIRLGMDIRIKCEGCDHSVLIPRREFTRKLKKILVKHEG
jgi:hypothetical protein